MSYKQIKLSCFDAEIQSFKEYPLAVVVDLKVTAQFPELVALSYCLVVFANEDVEVHAYVMQFNQEAQQLRLFIPEPDACSKEQLALVTTVRLSMPYFFGLTFSARGDGINIIFCDAAGMGSAIFLAEYYKKKGLSKHTLVFFEARKKFNFKPVPSQFISPFLPAHVIAAMPLMEDWGILSRLLNSQLPGCFEGSIDLLLSMVVEHVCQNPDKKIFVELIGRAEFLGKSQFQSNSGRVSLFKTVLAS